MKIKITLFILITGLIGASSWYYDINKFTMPKTIEITPWAKSHAQRQLSVVKKPVSADDVQKAYKHLVDKDVVYFKVRNGKTTYQVPGEYLTKITYFKVMYYVISKLAQQKHLKDNDFLVVLRDRADALALPPELKHVPLFVFAKDTAKKQNFTEILIVDSFTLKSWCEIYEDLKKGIKQYPWEKKSSKLFWRGKPSDGDGATEIRFDSPRIKLVKLTKQFPDRYDARLTKFLSDDPVQKKQVRELCGDIVSFSSTLEHLAFKYQITLDGVTATFPGYIWRMGSGCVNIKQDSTNEQWFYDLFKPNVHYLPAASDLSNLDTVLNKAITHDVEMKEMALQARRVIEQELTPSKVFGYLVELLNVYATKLK